MSFMKIINPENGATISGGGGDNIGRGIVRLKCRSCYSSVKPR
jgi:hypothetical protein